jgi:Zn-dependent M28 family amino/carboxypeptidase
MKKLSFTAGLLSLLAVFCAGFLLAQSGSPKTSPFLASRAYADMKAMVDLGPRPAGSAAIEKTRTYIVAELKKAGLKPEFDEFEAVTPRGRRKMVNIRAIHAGTKPATTIALSGHYDTKLFDEFKFVGASDGASSAAWLIEMARVTTNLKLESNLEFLFFDGEEAVVDWSDTDSRYGSRYDVDRRKKAGTLQQLRAIVLVDMIGDKNLNIKREGQSTDWLTSIIWNNAHALGFNREFLNESIIVEDDHLPYLTAQVPASDLIDFDYPDWHKQTDTLDKVSGESLKKVGDVVYASLPEIDRRVSSAAAAK